MLFSVTQMAPASELVSKMEDNDGESQPDAKVKANFLLPLRFPDLIVPLWLAFVRCLSGEELVIQR